jgi:hypothetical protein
MRRILLPLLIVACCAALIAAVWPQSSPTHLKASLAREVVTTTSSTSTSSSTTTTSTTEPPTTTTTAYVRRTVQSTPPRSTPQPRPSGGVAKPPHHSGYATSCMDNAAHTVAMAHSCWDDLLAKYAWSSSRAFSVLMCESEGNPWDYNPSSATGLMQELGGPYDPTSNIAVAYDMYSHRGWQPWDASKSCWVSAQKG